MPPDAFNQGANGLGVTVHPISVFNWNTRKVESNPAEIELQQFSDAFGAVPSTDNATAVIAPAEAPDIPLICWAGDKLSTMYRRLATPSPPALSSIALQEYYIPFRRRPPRARYSTSWSFTF